MAEVLRGAPAAAALTESLITRCERLNASGITPTLSVIRVGARNDDLAYENAAVRRCEKIGIAVQRYVMPDPCDANAILETIDSINADNTIHGCLMFRPLRNQDTEKAACERLYPEKDVDGMTRASLAHVFSGTGNGFAPCTAEACIKLLKHYGIDLAGKQVVILGRSLVVGKPLSMLMLSQNATVTVCHSRTSNVEAIARSADILVAALGKAELVTASYLRKGQIVLDVGIHEQEDGTLCGDVRKDDVASIVAAYTPSPGGVGSMTTTILAEHVIRACENISCNPANSVV